MIVVDFSHHSSLRDVTAPPSEHQGFTAIELMMALTVVAVLLGLGIPAFANMSAQNNLAITANSFVSAFALARQSAVNLNAPVALCAGDATGCHDTQNWDWAKGWLAFIDRDHDGALDADERVLHTGSAGRRSVFVQGNAPMKKPIIFMPMGFAEQPSGAFSAGTLRVCATANIPNNARDLVLSKSGRVRTESVDLQGACSAP